MKEGTVARAAPKSKRADEPRMVHVRLDPELHRRLRIVVAAEDTTMQDWLARVVENAVSEQWPNVVQEGD